MTITASPAVRSPWATFTVCAIASYISTLDMSIVNVAFYEIGKDFEGTPQSTVAWVVTAYSLLFGSLLVVSGRLADQIGRRRFFLQGTTVFFIGSFLCAIAPNMGTLILGRAAFGEQGMVFPLIVTTMGALVAALGAYREAGFQQ